MTPCHALRRPLSVLAVLAALVLGTKGAWASGPAALDLFVTSDASDVVRAYANGTGSYLVNHAASVLPADGELGIHFGASQGRFLVGHWSGGVQEFDSNTGAYIKTYSLGGGWMWSGIYAPNGEVLVASTGTDKIVRFDPNTAAPLGIFASVPGGPADLEYGPNGNLYVCAFNGGMVFELDGSSGAIVSAWAVPLGLASFVQPNDVAFLNGEILVTAMGPDVVYRFDSTPVHNVLGSFQGTGWMRPHGIAIGPADGKIYVADGVTTQVHVFDPLTFVELNPAFLNPNPGDKIVDIAFRPIDLPTPAKGVSWGRIKSLYR